VATVILVRHARTAETGIKLSGRIPGIPLSLEGRAEAAALGEALSSVRLAGIVTSPIQRCRETVEAIVTGRSATTPSRPTPREEERLSEVDYGNWSGKELRHLAKDPLWSVVQRQPSAMQFPKGEALQVAAARGAAAIREWDARFKEDDIWLAASHGDIIKAIVADALGTPLDLFQRITIDPASITVIRYGKERPRVLSVNETPAGGGSRLAPKHETRSLLGRLRGTR